MTNVALMFASREGQTEKIASCITQHLVRHGLSVELVNVADKAAIDAINLEKADLLVFGASMHAGGLEREMTRFIAENEVAIKQRARSFFLVSLSAATKDPDAKGKSLLDAQSKMSEQLAVDFPDTEMIAGALRYSKYPLLLKWIMRRIAAKSGEDTDPSRDYEYTDWQQVETYAVRLLTLR